MRMIGAGVLLLFSVVAYGQVLQGVVFDKLDRAPLTGALLLLSDGSSTVSDDMGRFQFESVASGRYRLAVSFLAYQDVVISDIVINSNRNAQLEVAMDPLPLALEAVTVRSSEPFQVGGRRTISEDQIYRFASTYYDPARIMTTSPDVVITNDQNNQISVRGLSPNYNVWRLEDVEIINPNHLSNAGTINDQPSGSGGGVNAISAQVLSNSSFHFGSMNAGLSNSVGGIFDLKLKSGNEEAFQFAAQASLIGFDFMADGPIGERTQLLANYRYSFTGLLSQLGVDFGGEQIGYQDLSLVTTTHFADNSRLKFFAVGGASFNDFEHTGYNNAERQKDLSDINYSGNIGVVGLRYDRNAWSFSYALSGTDEERREVFFDETDVPYANFGTENDRSIHSGLLRRKFKLKNGTIHAEAGVNSYLWKNASYTEVASGFDDWRQTLGFIGTEWNQYLSSKILTEFGIKYLSSLDESSLDYRAKVSYLLTSSNFYLSYGRYSQLINPINRFFDGIGPQLFDNGVPGDFIISYRSVAGYEWYLEKLQGSFEAFYYDFPEIEHFSFGQVGARTSGVSATLQKNNQQGWFALIGGSLFNSVINEEYNHQFNARYNMLANIGKEIKLKSENKRLEISMRQTVQGGNWYPDFSEFATPGFGGNSNDLFIAVPTNQSQTASYLRTDLRIQFTKDKKRTTRSFSLDIQNLLNRENEAFPYFDAFLNERLVSTQLGMIPNITYRIDF